jgi:hypothetical protein
MTTWEFLRELNEVCSFQTREGKRVGKATNSELKRWCQNGAVVINGEKVKWDQELIFPLSSMILFPKHPITLF